MPTYLQASLGFHSSIPTQHGSQRSECAIRPPLRVVAVIVIYRELIGMTRELEVLGHVYRMSSDGYRDFCY